MAVSDLWTCDKCATEDRPLISLSLENERKEQNPVLMHLKSETDNCTRSNVKQVNPKTLPNTRFQGLRIFSFRIFEVV